MALNMRDQDEIEEFAEYAIDFRDHWGCERLLIIIDTLNLSIGDGDENSARDMSEVVRNAQRLAKSTENGGAKLVHGGGGIVLLRAA